MSTVVRDKNRAGMPRRCRGGRSRGFHLLELSYWLLALLGFDQKNMKDAKGPSNIQKVIKETLSFVSSITISAHV